MHTLWKSLVKLCALLATCATASSCLFSAMITVYCCVCMSSSNERAQKTVSITAGAEDYMGAIALYVYIGIRVRSCGGGIIGIGFTRRDLGFPEAHLRRGAIDVCAWAALRRWFTCLRGSRLKIYWYTATIESVFSGCIFGWCLFVRRWDCRSFQFGLS